MAGTRVMLRPVTGAPSYASWNTSAGGVSQTFPPLPESSPDAQRRVRPPVMMKAGIRTDIRVVCRVLRNIENLLRLAWGSRELAPSQPVRCKAFFVPTGVIEISAHLSQVQANPIDVAGLRPQ